MQNATFSPGTVIPSGVVSGTSLTIEAPLVVPSGASNLVPATTILPNVFATLDAAATVGVGTVLPVGMRLFSVSVVGGALYTASTRPSLPNGTEGQIWAVAPMLPAGDLSWSLQFVSGADLAAADTQALRPEAVLGVAATPSSAIRITAAA